MTHTELQEQAIALAHLLGYEHLHVRRSVGRGRKWTTTTNVKGWPDLFLWSPRRQRVCAVEIKVPPDVVTDEQAKVLLSLSAAGVHAMVLHPDNFDHYRRFLDVPPEADYIQPDTGSTTGGRNG